MTKNPISVDKDMLAAKALTIMNGKKITSLSVYNKRNKLKTIGVIHIHNILASDIVQMKKKNLIIYIAIFISIILIISYYKYSKEKNISTIEKVVSDEESYKSNIMENVSYSSKDAKGNEYIVNASQGEIDYCLLYTSPSPRDVEESRMPSSA